MKKITLFGMPGAGKSTFAHQLGEKLNLPVHHIDRYFFRENWQEVEPDVFLVNLKKLVAHDQWIIDGNGLSTIEHRLKSADVIIYFQFPFLLCLWRVIKRRIFGNPFQDKPDGCPSVLTWRLIKFMWAYYRLIDPRALELLDVYKHKTVYIVKNPKEAQSVRENLS